MKRLVFSTNTSSKVSVSYLEPGGPACQCWRFSMFLKGRKGPSSTTRCLPTLPQRGMTVASSVSVAKQCTRLRGPYLSIQSLRVIEPIRIRHRVEVIEVAEEFVEAVHGRQVFVQVAEM